MDDTLSSATPAPERPDRSDALRAGPALTGAQLAACWADLKDSTPLVHCITNIVVAPFTANVLLAAGAAPAMIDNAHEAGGFAAASGALLINFGTPYDDTTAAMRAAVEGAVGAGTPWVLDPVGAGGLPWRTAVARDLLALGAPATIRGNASEIIGLSGGAGGRGVDATDRPSDASEAAAGLVKQHGSVIAVSGPVDLITDGYRLVQVPHGHPWMTKVTGVGCALGALMAACAATTADQLLAATTATTALTLAAESAASTTRGPGSFAVALVDELFALEPEHLQTRAALQ